MPFEKFEGTGSGAGATVTEPRISLRKSGSIGINNVALDEYFDGYDAAVMYFDEAENQVGLEPVEDKESAEHAYTVNKTESGGAVTASSFLRGNDLVPNITTRYSPEQQTVDDDLELITIDLDNPMGTYGEPADEENSG